MVPSDYERERARAERVAGNLKIRQTRSANGIKPNQRATLAALGLGRPGATSERADSPQLRGQLRAVEHLVSIDESGS